MNIIFFSPTFSTFVDSQRKNEHHISVPSERDCDFWTVKSRKSVNSDSKWGARNTLNVQAFKGENKSLFCLCYKIMTGILMELYRCLHHATFWRLHGSYLCSTYKVRDAFGACVCEQDIKKSESWDRKICKSDSKWKQRSARERAGTERAWPRARYTCVLTHARTHMAQFGAINHAGFGLRDRLTFTFRTFFLCFWLFFFSELKLFTWDSPEPKQVFFFFFPCERPDGINGPCVTRSRRRRVGLHKKRKTANLQIWRTGRDMN